MFNVAFLAGNGDGTFAPLVVLTTLPNPQRIVTGDFNQDGKLDFAVVGTDSSGQNWEFDVFLGHGDGTFTHLPAQQFPLSGADPPEQIFAIDLNHDGKLDLLLGLNANTGWVDSGDDLMEVLGNGDGTFQAPKVLISHFGAVAIADVNRDGYPDLIQSRDPHQPFGNTLLFLPAVTVYLGSADGTFHQQPSYDLSGVTPPSFNPVLVGDFNGDGIPDIAVRYWPVQPLAYLLEPSLKVLQGVGDGTFIVTGHTFQLPANSDPIVGTDFNGDGTTDLMELTGLTSSYSTIPAAPAPALDIALNSFPIVGTKGNATITLDLPAKVAEDVAVSSSDPAIQIPASVHFNAGQQSQPVSFTLGNGFDATHVFALYATLGTYTAVAYGTKPNPNLTVGVSSSITPSINIEPGQSFGIVYKLTSEGGYSGTFSSFQCSGLPAWASCAFSRQSLTVVPIAGEEGVTVTVTTSPSTPFGSHNVTVSSTDGLSPTSASFRLEFGDFSFSINPTTIVGGPSGNPTATLTTSSTYNLSEQLTLSCTGLPAGVTCGAQGNTYTSAGTMAFGLDYSQLTAADYAFQIAGTAGIVSHSINAVLRIGDFTATLDQTTASLAAGASATFNVTLASVNHYSSSITVFCEPASSTISCTASPVPATISDGSSTMVKLTVTNTAAKSSVRKSHPAALWIPPILSLLIPACALVFRKRAPFMACLMLMLTLAMISCGGGSGSNGGAGGGGGGNGGGGGGGSTPQTINVSVSAQAASTQSDSNNQKTIGPIVITVP